MEYPPIIYAESGANHTSVFSQTTCLMRLLGNAEWPLTRTGCFISFKELSHFIVAPEIA